MSEVKDIPKGWEEMKLGSFIKTGTGSVDPSKFKEEVFELYSIPSYSEGKPEIVQGSKIGSSKKVIIENDVLLSRIVPHIQRCWIVGKRRKLRQIGSGEWIIFDGSKINPKYLRLFLLSYKFHMQFMTTISGVGGSLTRANPKLTAQFLIPIPPPKEQTAIVSKIEELLSDLENGKQQLLTAQQQLKTYRQSLLKWAFEGRLTNPDRSVGTGANVNGELPKGWKWEKLSQLSVYVSDGDHLPPKKSESGIPFITISDIKNNKIDFSDTMFMTENYYQNLKENRKPIIGDVLYTVTGSFGIPVLINFEKEFCFQRHIGLIRPKADTNQRWLYYVLQSPQVFNQASETATGTAQKTVALKSLRNFNIATPPIKEQEQIVSELESKLTVCDKIEETITTSLQQAEMLKQSILKKAFEGRLVTAKEKA